MEEAPVGARIADPGIRALLSREALWQSWLDVESALARAEADLGMIPAAAADEIARKARLELLDRARIEEGLRTSEHSLVPLIWELDRVCDGDAGGYVHWGATTQNITQTGHLLQVRRAHRVLLGQLGVVLGLLADLAERTAGDLLPARTHGQHAVPATFGFKVAAWIDELCRHVDRLRGCESRVFVTMLGGAAGTFASFGADGQRLQARLAELLETQPMGVPARTAGDHMAEYVTVLGLLAATCSKVAHEVFTLMKQEFGEVEEPFSAGLVGSSTMPQKRNPKLSQDIMAAAARIRAAVPLALEAMQTEHEADRTTTVMMSAALDESVILAGDILERMRVLFTGLRVFPDRMRRNLDLSGGLIMSEALMLELGRAIGRQRAHDAIYDAAQESAESGRPFRDLLAASAAVTERLSAEQIESLLDPAHHVGLCRELALQQAEHARAVARET